MNEKTFTAANDALCALRHNMIVVVHVVGHLCGLFGGVKLSQQVNQRRTQGVPWVAGFTHHQVADGRLAATADGRYFGLGEPVLLNFCDGFFPVHGRNNNEFPLFSKRFIVIGYP